MIAQIVAMVFMFRASLKSLFLRFTKMFLIVSQWIVKNQKHVISLIIC